MSFSSGWCAWAGVAEAIREQAGKKEIEALCRRSTSSNDDVPGLDALNEMKYLKRPFVAVKLALLSKHISISSVHRSLSVHKSDHISARSLPFLPVKFFERRATSLTQSSHCGPYYVWRLILRGPLSFPNKCIPIPILCQNHRAKGRSREIWKQLLQFPFPSIALQWSRYLCKPDFWIFFPT